MKQRSAGKSDIGIRQQNILRRIEQQIVTVNGIHPKNLKSYKDPKFVYKDSLGPRISRHRTLEALN
jgi:hypothetical protein